MFVYCVGGWGARCNGNNPGCYRDDNWSKCFGTLVVGGTFAITFDSSEAVENFLPAGGKSEQLVTNHLNPAKSLGILASQLTALSLSVGFDICNDDFSSSGSSLGDQVYCAGGLCDGMTVSQILTLGQQVLGGAQEPPWSDDLGILNTCVTIINENYVDGTIDEGNLCSNPTLRCAPSSTEEGHSSVSAALFGDVDFSATSRSFPSSLPSIEPSVAPSDVRGATPNSSTGPSSPASSLPSVIVGPGSGSSKSPSNRPSSSPSSNPSLSSAPSSSPSSEPRTEPSTSPSTSPNFSAQPSSSSSSKPSLRGVPSSGPSSEPSTGLSTSPSWSPSLLAQPSSSF